MWLGSLGSDSVCLDHATTWVMSQLAYQFSL